MKEFLQGVTPREYQEKILETCKKKNCLVVLPTGLGKTLIALLLTIHRMKEHPGEKVLMLAPTKPLAEQHLASFKKTLPELFAEITLFTGTVKAEERKKRWKFSDIIFSTPQCIANDVKKRLYTLNDVCLLIEDEAHRCVKNYAYNYVAQEYKKQATHPKILGLTASPGSDKAVIRQICKNLGIDAVELRTRESPDVKGYLKERSFEKELVPFPKKFVELRVLLETLLAKFIDELKIRNVLHGPANKISLIKLQQRLSLQLSKGNRDYNLMLAASSCAQAVKIYHALELIETQTIYSLTTYLEKLEKEAKERKSKGVQRLVAQPQFSVVKSTCDALLKKGIEHPKVERATEIIQKEQREKNDAKIILFTQYRDTGQALKKILKEKKIGKPELFVGQAKKGETGMSQKEQKRIIEQFREGEINILIATSIAEEGLDIPEVSAVIFYEPIPSAIRAIQRAGRTARLAKGKLIVLITKETRDEAYYYVSRSREKQMHTAIEHIKEELKNPQKEEQQQLFKGSSPPEKR